MPLSSLSGSTHDNVTWCLSLSLDSLFETASDPQSVAISFRLGWSLLVCPAGFPSAEGLGVVHLCLRALPVPPLPASRRGLWCYWEGEIPGSTPAGAIQSPRKMIGVFPTTSLGLAQILSSNVWFLVN